MGLGGVSLVTEATCQPRRWECGLGRSRLTESPCQAELQEPRLEVGVWARRGDGLCRPRGGWAVKPQDGASQRRSHWECLAARIRYRSRRSQLRQKPVAPNSMYYLTVSASQDSVESSDGSPAAGALTGGGPGIGRAAVSSEGSPGRDRVPAPSHSCWQDPVGPRASVACWMLARGLPQSLAMWPFPTWQLDGHEQAKKARERVPAREGMQDGSRSL